MSQHSETRAGWRRRVSNRLSRFTRRWGALIVALLALATAVGSAYEDRRHKRLSVRPHLLLTFNFQLPEQAGWYLANTGLGPAIVQWFEVYVDEKPQTDWEMLGKSLGLGQPLLVNFSIPRSFEIASGASGLYIVKQEPGNPPTARNLAVLMKNFERVRMEICYCSLYEECWMASTSEHQMGRKFSLACALPKLGQNTWTGNKRQE